MTAYRRYHRKHPIRWGALVAALTTITGLLSLPQVLALLPAKWSAVVIAIGAVAQALTKPVPRTEQERRAP